MNKDVKISGMELKTKVSGNLLICDDNEESHFSSDELVQARKALLEPVSTTTAQDGSFFYTRKFRIYKIVPIQKMCEPSRLH